MPRPKAGRKAGRPKGDRPPKRNIVALRGTEEWRDWLNGLAAHNAMPATVLIDQALRAYAKSTGFDEPMPKR